MNGETPSSLTHRMDLVEGRLTELEGQIRTQGRGLWAKISRLGIIVGCIGGILGGTNTFLNLWKQAAATPKVDLILGDWLRIYWSWEDQRLSLTCGATLQNKGETIGIVKAARGYLKANGPRTGKQQCLSDIHLSEKRADIPFPISIRASDARDLEITMTSSLNDNTERAFFEEGLYTLIVEIDVPNKLPRNYCIYMGKSLLRELEEKGDVMLFTPDTRCSPADAS